MRSRNSSLSVPNPYRNVGVNTAVPAELDETGSRECVHWASKECAAAAVKGQFEY